MTLWPPDWHLIFGIVTFITASFAVRGWRDLGVFVLLMALLILPLKWMGTSLGFPAMGEHALIWHAGDTGHWKIEFKATIAFTVAAFLGALLMLAWKRMATRRTANE